MKRLLFLLVIMIFLYGCTEKQGVSFNTDSLNTSFSLKADDYVMKGNISFDNKKIMNVHISYPQNISGLSLLFNDDSVTSNFDGVTDTYYSSELPDDFTLLKIYNLFIMASNSSESFTRNIDSFYEASFDGMKLLLDENGKASSITFKNGNIVFGV